MVYKFGVAYRSENSIEGLIGINDVLLPVFIGDGEVLRKCSVFLKLLRITVNENEIGVCTVFKKLQNLVTDVACHIGRATRIIEIAMIYKSEEGNCLGRLCTARAVERNAENVVCITYCICVTAFKHEVIAGFTDLCKGFLNLCLRVLAVVRLILVEVGGNIRTEATECNALKSELLNVLFKLCEDAFKRRGSNNHHISGCEMLKNGRIGLFLNETVVNCADSFLTAVKSVEHSVLFSVCEVGIEIDLKTVLVCVLLELLQALVAAYDLFSLDMIGDSVLKTAVNEACELEHEVLNACITKLLLDGLDILEGSQRLHYLNGDGKELFLNLHCTESLDVKRNICCFCNKILNSTGLIKIVSIRICHSDVIGVEKSCIIDTMLCVILKIGEHYVSDHKVSGVLTVGYLGKGVVSGRGCYIKRVGVLRTRVKLSLNVVVGMALISMYCTDLGKRITLFNYCKEALIAGYKLILAGLNVLNYRFNRLNETEYRHSHRHEGLSDLKGMVCIVLTVGHCEEREVITALLNVLKSGKGTGSVREYCVTNVTCISRAHEGKASDLVELEGALVITNTVCRHSYLKSVLIEIVLECYAELYGLLDLGLILTELVVKISFLVGVVGTVGLKDPLNGVLFLITRVCIEDV